MLDFFGRQIQVGHRVSFVCPGYRNLISGVIIRITAQRVRVSYQERGREQTHLTCGQDVVIHPDDLA